MSHLYKPSELTTDSHKTLQVANRDFYYSSSFQYSTRPDLWDTRIVGSGSVQHNPNNQTIEITVGAGASVLRRTTKLIPYFTGRTVQMSFAGRFDPDIKDTVTQKVGIFDDNNGLYFQLDSGGLRFNIKNNGDESNHVYQENWNQDKLDGTGPSGITLNPYKFQVGVIEYEWYGAGRVKFGVIVEDDIIWAHFFDFANSLESPYMGTAVLPLSFEVISSTGIGTVVQGSSVSSLIGNIPTTGQPRVIGVPIATPVTVGSSNIFHRIVSLRLNPAYINAIVTYNSTRSFGDSNSNYQYKVSVQDTFLNNNGVGTSSPSGWNWIDAPGSVLQYSIPSSLSLPERVNHGIIFDCDYFRGQTSSVGGIPIQSFISQMGRKIDGTSDIWTLSITSDSPSKTAVGSISWVEISK
jgi:hypothetical protein